MKSWFTKFRISIALDSRDPMPASLRNKIAADQSLQRFVHQAEALRTLPPPPLIDPSMHDGIMRAVRASARTEEAGNPPVTLWLVASGAVAAMFLFGFWMIHLQMQSPELASPFGGLALLVKRALAGAILP